MESLFKTDYPICNSSNIDMGRIEIESVKEFIENFLVRSGYGVGN